MTLRHISFQNSEVMRELERLELDKSGPEKTNIPKTASQQDSSLLSQIICLAKFLRSSGRTDDADRLDEKIALYCTAADTHLYRTHDEEGEDLINFAHPEGDVTVAPAQQNWGKVETLISQHKKIVDIINKTPTGKYAKQVQKILVKAQDYTGGLTTTKPTTMVPSLSARVKNTFNKTLRPTYSLNMWLTGINMTTQGGNIDIVRYANHGQWSYNDKQWPTAWGDFQHAALIGGKKVDEADLITAARSSGDFNKIMKPYVAAANKGLEIWFNILDYDWDKLSSVNLNETEDFRTTRELLYQYTSGNKAWLIGFRMITASDDIRKFVWNDVWTAYNLVQQEWGKKPKKVQLQEAAFTDIISQPVANQMCDKWIQVWETANRAVKLEGQARQAQMNFANSVQEVFGQANGKIWGDVYKQLIQIDPQDPGPKNWKTLSQWLQQANRYIGALEKYASLKRKMKKVAAPPPPPPPSPSAVETPPVDIGPSSKKLTRRQPPGVDVQLRNLDSWKRRQIIPWYEDVTLMQTKLNQVANVLSQLNASLKLNLTNAQVARYAAILRGTGHDLPREIIHDGKWGPNTYDALNLLKTILGQHSSAIKIDPGPITDQRKGYLYAPNIHTKEIQSRASLAAQTNIQIIDSILRDGGLVVPDPTTSVGTDREYDRLPSESLFNLQFDISGRGGYILSSQHLATLQTLDNWLSLHRLNLSASEGSSGMTKSQWETVFYNLKRRADDLRKMAEDRGNVSDQTNAVAYGNAIERLFGRFVAALGVIRRETQYTDKTLLTGLRLEEAFSGLVGAPGVGSSSEATTSPRATSPVQPTTQGVETTDAAPYDITSLPLGNDAYNPTIDIKHLRQRYNTPNLNSLGDYIKPFVSVHDINHTPARQLITLIALPSESEIPWATVLRDLGYSSGNVPEGRRFGDLVRQYQQRQSRSKGTPKHGPSYMEIGTLPWAAEAKALILQEHQYINLAKILTGLLRDLASINNQFANQVGNKGSNLAKLNDQRYRIWNNALSNKIREVLREKSRIASGTSNPQVHW